MCCGKSRNTTVTPKFSCNLNTIAWLSLHGLKEHTINLYLPAVVVHTVGKLKLVQLEHPFHYLGFPLSSFPKINFHFNLAASLLDPLSLTPSEDINFLIRQLLASAFFCIWVLCSHCEKWNKLGVCSWWVIQENIAPPPHLGEQLKWRKMLFSCQWEELCTFDNLQPLQTQMYLCEKVRRRLYKKNFSSISLSIEQCCPIQLLHSKFLGRKVLLIRDIIQKQALFHS